MRNWCYVYVLSLSTTLAQVRIELLTVEYGRFAPPEWNFLCRCIPSHLTPGFIGTLLTLAEGDTVEGVALRHDELLLSSSAAIASVRYELDTLTEGKVELRWIVIPRCLHTVVPAVTVGAAFSSLGATVQVGNFWGTGEYVSASLRYRRELDIGWESNAAVFLPVAELFEVDAFLRLHRFRTLYTVGLSSSALPWGWGAQWHGERGMFWDFRSDSLPTYRGQRRQAQAWLRWGTQRRDALFITVSGMWQRGRVDSGYRQAAENTAWVLLGVGSLARRPERVSSPFVYGDSCTTVTGAWGAVTLGLGIPVTADGERLSYIAGELEQSANDGCLLVTGRIAAGNAFAQRIPRYTTLEIALSGWLAMDPTPLVLSWEGQHQNVWNWPSYRVERLDWLSGFPAPFPSKGGDNRATWRTELRWRGKPLCPELGWSASLFHHLGTVWNQGTPLTRAHFRSALGIGLRLHVEGRHTPPWQFRAEAAYNWTLQRLLLMLQVGLSPSPLALHHYRLPRLLGMPLTSPP